MKKQRSFRRVVFVLLAAMSASGSGHAASFAEKCPDIPACAKVVAEMLGQHYLFDTGVKGKIHATPKLELTRENAELLFTEMLNMNGFSRVPSGQPKTFEIQRMRDARDQPLPMVTGTQTESPRFPNTWDLITMQYKATYPNGVEHIARAARPHMPANARIVPDSVSGMIMATDTSLNLKKLYDIIKELDQPVPAGEPKAEK